MGSAPSSGKGVIRLENVEISGQEAIQKILAEQKER